MRNSRPVDLEPIVLGQQVLVFDVNGRASGQPGEVTRVGRTLFTVRGGGIGELDFRLDNRSGNGPYGSQRWVRTLGEAEQERRWESARDTLRAAGVDLAMHCRLTAADLERLVAALPDDGGAV
jgi:hypothetical protein